MMPYVIEIKHTGDENPMYVEAHYGDDNRLRWSHRVDIANATVCYDDYHYDGLQQRYDKSSLELRKVYTYRSAEIVDELCTI